MYLTFKDKHDSNVAQRDVWYKKEKCYFDCLYHNRLSLSSTLFGEEPNVALHQKLYLIFSEHTLFTLVRENQQISDFCTSLGRKPYCLSSTCCGEEPANERFGKIKPLFAVSFHAKFQT
ncbi:hypothetical protein [Geobacillus zalihae]|uniref:hypothetical protein n=1 Tax=Geobacillus zalihae TaxID=213419 RepID=UPI001428A9CB|nr:hypothetical protein [Geobacillus zalihae]